MYDHNDPNYKNSVFVDKGWQEVSKEFGEPVTECKKKWRHLRSSLSRYIKSSKDELKNKNNKLKPYYLLTHMNFLVPYTKTLDTKSDTVVCNKFEPPDQNQTIAYEDEDMKADEQSQFEHEIIQDEDSHDGMDGNIVYEAYEIQEQIPTSSAAASQPQSKPQITLVRSTNNQNTSVQQLPISINTISSPNQQKTLQLNSAQITQIQQHHQQSQIQAQNSLPVQNTIIPIPDDQSSADLNFFLALLPDIKAMNQEQKRKLRIGTLKLIDDILSTSN